MSKNTSSANFAIKKINALDCFFCDARFEKITAVIGIGNPGQRFVGTRHNAGFDVIDSLADYWSYSFNMVPQAHWFEYSFEGKFSKKVIFYKPQTFVNLTGELTTMLKGKGFAPEQIMCVYDDMEKAPGFVGFKIGGSAKGHNGVKSVIQSLGFDFWRLTVGIGRPCDGQPVEQYVLGRFSLDEKALYDQSIDRVVSFFNCRHL